MTRPWAVQIRDRIRDGGTPGWVRLQLEQALRAASPESLFVHARYWATVHGAARGENKRWAAVLHVHLEGHARNLQSVLCAS